MPIDPRMNTFTENSAPPALSQPTDLHKDQERILAEEMAGAFIRNVRTSPIFHLVLGVGVLYLLVDEINSPWLWTWATALLFGCCARAIAVLWDFGKSLPKGKRLRIQFAVSTTLSTLKGVTWGLLPLVTGLDMHSGSMGIVITFIAGIAAAGATLQAPVLSSALAFVTAVLFPGSVLLLCTGGKSTVLGIVWLVYTASLFYVAAVLHYTLRRAISLRLSQELLAKSLDEARLTAESASRAKSEFLARMSHEIRTPMNGVIGMATLGLDRARDSDIRECFEVIDQSAHALLGIINDILDISRVEAGKLRVEEQPFRIKEVVRGVVMSLGTLGRQREVKLTEEMSNQIPEIIQGDALRVTQVLTNLVGNAVKFTQPGGTVTVRLTRVEHRGPWLQLAVIDSGIGIPASIQNRIFEAFEQGDGSIARRFGGTGLGLAIAASLVSLMGGTIRCESKEGVGSTFLVELPCREGVIAESLERETRPLPQEGIDTQNKRRVLVVEDNRVNQLVTQKILEGAGYEVVTAEDGEAALSRWREEPFDLVLMDCQMPRVDGFEATRRIRTEERNGYTPIVALTAHAMEEERHKCLTAGMDDFVTKPIERHQLLEVIARRLNRAPRTQS